MIAELEEELITSLSELDLVKILQLKKRLEEKLPVIEKLDTEILDLLEEEEEIAEDIEKADEYKGLTYAAIIRAEKGLIGAPTTRSVSATTVTLESGDSEQENTILPALQTTTRLAVRSANPADSDEESSSSSSGSKIPTADTATLIASEHSSTDEPTLLLPAIHAKTSVKLPKLALRPFSGDLTQWFTFGTPSMQLSTTIAS